MTDPKPITSDDIEPIARSARLELSQEQREIEQPVVWKFLSGVITHPGIPI